MYTSLLVGLAVTVGAPVTKEKDPPKEAAIVGEWEGTKAVAGGKEMPVPEGGIRFEFTADGKLIIHEGKKDQPDTGTYKVDTKKDPAELDMIPPVNQKVAAPPSIPGIFKVDGDTLTLCFSKGPEATTKRPTKFESTDGSDTILITMKRVKK